jgi:hypothetical protein
VLYGISGDALLDESSYQYQALQWIVFEDEMTAPQSPKFVASLIERYIIALLYFATNGPLWKSKYEFLTPRSVCDWNEVVEGDLFGAYCDTAGLVDTIYLGM